MTSLTLPSLGLVTFPPTTEGHWPFSCVLPSGSVKIDFNVRGGPMTTELARRTEKVLADLPGLDDAARAAIRAELAGGTGRSIDFLEYHVEEFSEAERVACFGCAEEGAIGAEQLLPALYLRRIGLYPENPDELAVLDYQLKEVVSDQILVVYVDCEREVQGIDMES